jgi:hypothetical protein
MSLSTLQRIDKLIKQANLCSQGLFSLFCNAQLDDNAFYIKALEGISHIKKVHVSSYQSASGAGASGMAELEAQVKQFVAGDQISEGAQREIQSIIDELSIRGEPDKIQEIERLRKVCRTGKTHKTKPVKVDLYLEGIDGEKHLFDLKTAKPNKSNFKDFKRTSNYHTGAYDFCQGRY